MYKYLDSKVIVLIVFREEISASYLLPWIICKLDESYSVLNLNTSGRVYSM